MKNRKTNFDIFLEEQLRDPKFAEMYERAGEAWDVAMQIVDMREKAGLTQAQLARKVGTTQQQISRLEGAGYEGHSLSMLRRIAKALDARVRVSFEPLKAARNPIRPAQRQSTRKPRTRNTV